MQTARSQSQQARQKIDKFRLSLSFAVFFPYVLFLALFNAVLYRAGVTSRAFVLSASLVLAVVVGLLVFSALLIRAILRERRYQLKEVSRARCLITLADVMNAGELSMREKIKESGRVLAEEGERSGWRCRIVLQENPSFLPPSSPRLGTHVPLKAGGKMLGTLLISIPGGKFDEIDENFFDIVSRSMGLFVHKEKSWENFHSDSTRKQAKLLLHGSVENSVDNKL